MLFTESQALKHGAKLNSSERGGGGGGWGVNNQITILGGWNHAQLNFGFT